MRYYMNEYFNDYLRELDPFDRAICEDIFDEKGILPAPMISRILMPKSYIINKDATILFWSDGEKTIVKRCNGDEFNPRLGFLTAYFQHLCGMSKNKANKYLANLKVEEPKIKEKRKPKHMKEEKL